MTPGSQQPPLDVSVDQLRALDARTYYVGIRFADRPRNHAMVFPVKDRVTFEPLPHPRIVGSLSLPPLASPSEQSQ
jgi:hypothetical protein